MDTAKAFEEIGRIDLAIDWAQRATDADPWHQAAHANQYLRTLLSEHDRARLLDASRRAFNCHRTSDTASWVHTDAGDAWPELRDEVLAALEASPRDAVLFTLNTLRDAAGAWSLAQRLKMRDADVWLLLAKAHEKTDPVAVIPILRELALAELDIADAKHYRKAAQHLKRCRKAGRRNLRGGDRQRVHRRPARRRPTSSASADRVRQDRIAVSLRRCITLRSA